MSLNESTGVVRDLGRLLTERGWMLACAESCTGGLVAGALTDIPGSSKVFDRGFVTYTNVAKSEMLGVPPSLIVAHGAVSAIKARLAAEHGIEHATVEPEYGECADGKGDHDRHHGGGHDHAHGEWSGHHHAHGALQGTPSDRSHYH